MSETFTTTIASFLFLDLDWSVLSQDIPGNRSRVRLTLKLRHTGSGIWFSAPKNGVLQGSSFTYTDGFSGSGVRTLQTRDIWVNHNSDGSRTQNFNASFNVAINYQGTQTGNASVSGNATLPTIPRSSEVTAFSMGSSLQISTSNSVNVRLNVYSTSFRFDVVLRYGSTTIASWGNQNFTHNTSRSLSLSTGEVNNLLSAMRNTTSGTVTIRVQTKSGSGGSNIGSVQTRNATASVHSNVTPNATSLRVLISGSGRDDTIGKFVQGISRVFSDFTGTATGGATVSSRSIVIRENSSKSNSMTISGNSGTTGTVTRSGLYEAIASVTDSRGRTTTQRITFTVHAYEPPRITTFSANRNESTPTTVNIRRAGSFSGLSGDNTLTIQIQRRPIGGTWANVVSNVTTSGGSFDATLNSTGNVVTASYEFRVYISDQFNNDAEATSTVTTQQVVLDIHKDEGVGVGKIHEDGVLDVGGESYFRDTIHLDNKGVFPRTTGNSGETPARDYPLGFTMEDTGGSKEGFPNPMYNLLLNFNVDTSRFLQMISRHGNYAHLYFRNHHPTVYNNGVSDWLEVRGIKSRGTTSDTEWVEYSDGTLILWGRYRHNRADGDFYPTFPVRFDPNKHVSCSVSSDWSQWQNMPDSTAISVYAGESSLRSNLNSRINLATSTGDIRLTYIAIGKVRP